MKKLVLILFLACAAPASVGFDDLEADVQRFHGHWDKFMRARYGCSKTAASTAECDPALATFDYAEFLAARKAAKKLFGLEEKHGEKEKHETASAR